MARKTRTFVQATFLIGFLLLWHFTRTPLKLWIPANSWLAADPLLALNSWIVNGRLSSLFWPAAVLLVASVVGGRIFCGWVCPVGTILDFETSLLRRLGFRYPAGKARWPRLNVAVFVVTVIAGAMGLSLASGLLDPLVFAHRALTFMRAGRLPETLLVLIGLGLVAPRFWCRYLCPLGGLLGLLGRFAPVKRCVEEGCTKCGQCARACPMGAIGGDAQESSSACVRCGTCKGACPTRQIRFFGRRDPGKPAAKKPATSRRDSGLTRRQFLLILAGATTAGLARSRVARAAGAGVAATGGLIRPPGSLSESKLVGLCVRCGECVKVCPTRGLVPATTEAGWQGLWTPHLVPRIGECKRCMLCGRVCPTGAIRPIPVSLMKIGSAKLDHSSCWAWNGTKKCRVCYQRCPKRIIGLDAAGRPVVDENACDGCGTCEKYCPVKLAAIKVRPDGERRRDQQGSDDAEATVREEL